MNIPPVHMPRPVHAWRLLTTLMRASGRWHTRHAFRAAVVWVCGIQLLAIYLIITRKPSPARPIMLDRQSFDMVRTDTLTHYYEPKADSVELATASAKGRTYHVVYHINSETLHSRKEYARQKAPGIYRIIALGDSYTFGMGVATGMAWPTQLEQILNEHHTCDGVTGYEVLNFGVSGFDLEYAAERFIRRGREFGPDLVLWMVLDNDLTHAPELLSPFYGQYTEEMRRSPSPYPMDTVYVKASDAYRGVPHTAVAQHEQRGIDRYFQYRGSVPTVFFGVNYFSDDMQRELTSFVGNRPGVYYYMYLSRYDQSVLGGLQEYWQDDGHPMVKMHALYAREIADYLATQPYFPCRTASAN